MSATTRLELGLAAVLLGAPACGWFGAEDGEPSVSETGDASSDERPPPREPTPAMLEAPDYGDAAYLGAGAGPSTTVHRLDAGGWTTLAGPEPGFAEDEAIVEHGLMRGPDGRLFALTTARVLTVDDASPKLIDHAPLPPAEPVASELRMLAPGLGGELWMLVPGDERPRTFVYAGERWTEVGEAPAAETLVGAAVDGEGRPWLLGRTHAFRGDALGNSWTSFVHDRGLARVALRLWADEQGLLAASSASLIRVDAGAASSWFESSLSPGVDGLAARQGRDGPMVLVGEPDCKLWAFDLEERATSELEVAGDRCDWLADLALDDLRRIWLLGADALTTVDEAGKILLRHGVPEGAVELEITGAGPRRSPELLEYPGPGGERPKPAVMVTAPGGFSLQLASKGKVELAEAALAELDDALLARGSKLRPHLLRRDDLWVLMLGDFTSAEAAEAELAGARQLLGEGAVVRDMDRFCPAAVAVEAGRSRCVEAGAVGLRMSEIRWSGDPSAPEAEFSELSFPPVQSPPNEPGPFVHPPASELLVITASRRPDFGDGEAQRVKYETLIWRPEDPAEPGPVDPAELERHPGILVSDGAALWELRVHEAKLKKTPCECGEDDYVVGKGSFRARELHVERRPRGGGEWTELASIDPDNCAADADDWRADNHLMAIAGARVFLVSSWYEYQCGAHGFDYSELVVVDLGPGATGHDELFAELPSALIDKARVELRRALLDNLLADGPEDPQLWPHHLRLEGSLPKFTGRKPQLEILALHGVPYMESGAWASYEMEGWTSVELPPSSSLHPPAAVVELAKHKGRGKVVIGWSQTLVEPPSPSAAGALPDL